MTPQERGSLFTELNYDFNDNVSTYAEVLFTHTSSGFALASLPFDAVADDTVVSANNIYNPFGTDFGGVDGRTPTSSRDWSRSAPRHSDVSTNDSIVNFGFKGKFLDNKWEWDTNFSYSRKDQDQNISGYLLKNNLQQALGPSFIDADGAHCGAPGAVIAGCTPIDIFNVEDPAQIAALKAISSNYRNNYVYRAKSASVNLTGSAGRFAGRAAADRGRRRISRPGRRVLERCADARYASAVPELHARAGDLYRALLREVQREGNLRGAVRPDPQGSAGHLRTEPERRHSQVGLLEVARSATPREASSRSNTARSRDVLVRGSYAQVFRAPTIADLSFAPSQNTPTFRIPARISPPRQWRPTRTWARRAWAFRSMRDSASRSARSPASSSAART